MRFRTTVRIAVCCLVACTRGGELASTSQQDSLHGTWRIVSFAQRSLRDSLVHYPLGRAPRGYLVYDNVGHVSFQALRPSAIDSLRTGESRGAPRESLYELLSGYQAYFGTYTVDSILHTVTHHIEGELPLHGGTFEVSTVFRLDGDTLVLGSDSAQAWHFVRVK